jgi:hypothetical protein
VYIFLPLEIDMLDSRAISISENSIYDSWRERERQYKRTWTDARNGISKRWGRREGK